MSWLVLFLPILPAAAQGILCPDQYTDGDDGSCYQWNANLFSITRNDAYQLCSDVNAYIPDISSAEESTKFIQYSSHSQMWLGLTCLKDSIDSCVWDSGQPLTSSSYNNFAKDDPNMQAGPCVYMDTSTGKWHSADCSNYAIGYACKYTPGINIPYCGFRKDSSHCGTFRGKCYCITDARSPEDAAYQCFRSNYVQASIHSDGENAFVKDLVVAYSGFYSLLFLGIQNNGLWVDGSLVDYTNYDYVRPRDRCISMVVDDRGKWVTSACSASLTICSRENTPSPTTTDPVPEKADSSLPSPKVFPSV